jgi:glycosyltransferase involved in cell wall biosynthesis
MGWRRILHDVAKVVNRNGVIIIHTQEDADYVSIATKINSSKIIVAAPSNLTHEMRSLRDDIRSNSSKDNKFSRIQSVFKQDFEGFWISYVGFLNDYKGLDYIFEVLENLPSNFRLIIAGGIHERSADDFVDSHPITQKLLTILGIESNSIMDKKRPFIDKKNNKYKIVSSDLKTRIHFIPNPSDLEITETIIGSDAVSLLYRNVNQSASGPLVEALELGATAIASNNRLFRKFKNLAANQLNLIDVGNTLQARDELIRLASLRKIADVSPYRFISYDWSSPVNFSMRFKEGYSEAFRELGFSELSNKLSNVF